MELLLGFAYLVVITVGGYIYLLRFLVKKAVGPDRRADEVRWLAVMAIAAIISVTLLALVVRTNVDAADRKGAVGHSTE